MNDVHTPKLSLKQKLFCEYYLESSGNATEAVIKAGYNVAKKGQPDRNLAKSIASENLTKPDILEYLNMLLEKNGLNDQIVASHLKFLIQQFSDLSIKARAIDIYYKLHGKYAPTKVENDISVQVNETLDRIAKLIPKSAN